MRALQEQLVDFVRLLFVYDPWDVSDRRIDAWLWVMGVAIALVLLWAAFLQMRLYVFKIPSRWHTPEALARAGIAPSSINRRSVMATLGLTLTRCCEGVCLIGQTGSGKSTVLYRLLREVLSILRNGIYACGCLWLTAKVTEVDAACKVLKKAGRVPKIFKPGVSRCNLFVYEMTRPGGSAATLAEYLERASEVLNSGRGKEDSFWESIRKHCSTLATAVVWIAYRKHSTFEKLYDFLVSVPPSLAALTDGQFLNSDCRTMLELAKRNCRTEAEQRIVIEAINFFTNLLPAASEKVFGATVGHLSALIAPFLREEWYSTINCLESDVLPDDPLRGECLVMDCAVVINPANHLFQVLMGMMTIEATLRRPVTPDMPIVALVRDEYQLLGNSKFDAQAQTIARQQGLACFTAFQSLPVLYESCSEPVRAKYQAASLLGNLNTKALLANSDQTTCDFFSELLGKQFRAITGGGQSPQQSHRQHDMLGVDGDFNFNFHQQLMPRRLGTALANLRTGGPDNGFVVDLYVHAPGRRFNGQTFAKVSIEQDVP